MHRIATSKQTKQTFLPIRLIKYIIKLINALLQQNQRKH